MPGAGGGRNPGPGFAAENRATSWQGCSAVRSQAIHLARTRLPTGEACRRPRLGTGDGWFDHSSQGREKVPGKIRGSGEYLVAFDLLV